MKKKEFLEVAAQMQNIYSGILYNYRSFDGEKAGKVTYNFSCPEYTELRDKYELVKIAGKGSDFKKTKRLLHYFASKLTHSSWYDNHKDNKIANIKYRINHLPKEYRDWIPQYEEWLNNAESAEYTVYDAEIMMRSPLGRR